MTSPDAASARSDRARAWVLDLRARFRTIFLATASAEGEPDASVAGAILAPDGSFRIFVSGLATHTRHLLAHRCASVLLTEDEADAPQPLARRRLTFTCAAEPIARNDAEYAPSLLALRERLGPAFDLIAGLGDFQLIRLAPERGRLVAGFGETYTVNPHDWSQLTPLGRPRG
jgi:putative heme iron utilization protein